MAGEISYLSLTAAALYALVALASIMASATANSYGQPAWNRNVWAALALLFLLLIIMRLTGVEELARDWLRETMRADGSYDGRRQVQGLIASVVLVFIAAAGFFWTYRVVRKLRGRRNFSTVVALAAGSAMVFLVMLRMISLHMIDRALYGALKLNWVGDIGASFVILGAAIYYTKLVRARP